MSQEKFQSIVILILILGIIGLGIIVRVQNLSIADLTQSVATLSGSVYDIVVKKEAQLVKTGRQVAGIANPASQSCAAGSGTLEIESKPDGSQYGVCYLGATRACEEWAYYRGDCPPAGIDISGLTEQADIYCAVTGHQVQKSATPGNTGTCTVNGVTCSSQEFFETDACKYSIVQPAEAPAGQAAGTSPSPAPKK